MTAAQILFKLYANGRVLSVSRWTRGRATPKNSWSCGDNNQTLTWERAHKTLQTVSWVYITRVRPSGLGLLTFTCCKICCNCFSCQLFPLPHIPLHQLCFLNKATDLEIFSEAHCLIREPTIDPQLDEDMLMSVWEEICDPSDDNAIVNYITPIRLSQALMKHQRQQQSRWWVAVFLFLSFFYKTDCFIYRRRDWAAAD